MKSQKSKGKSQKCKSKFKIFSTLLTFDFLLLTCPAESATVLRQARMAEQPTSQRSGLLASLRESAVRAWASVIGRTQAPPVPEVTVPSREANHAMTRGEFLKSSAAQAAARMFGFSEEQIAQSTISGQTVIAAGEALKALQTFSRNAVVWLQPMYYLHPKGNEEVNRELEQLAAACRTWQEYAQASSSPDDPVVQRIQALLKDAAVQFQDTISTQRTQDDPQVSTKWKQTIRYQELWTLLGLVMDPGKYTLRKQIGSFVQILHKHGLVEEDVGRIDQEYQLALAQQAEAGWDLVQHLGQRERELGETQIRAWIEEAQRRTDHVGASLDYTIDEAFKDVHGDVRSAVLGKGNVDNRPINNWIDLAVDRAIHDRFGQILLGVAERTAKTIGGTVEERWAEVKGSNPSYGDPHSIVHAFRGKIGLSSFPMAHAMGDLQKQWEQDPSTAPDQIYQDWLRRHVIRDLHGYAALSGYVSRRDKIPSVSEGDQLQAEEVVGRLSPDELEQAARDPEVLFKQHWPELAAQLPPVGSGPSPIAREAPVRIEDTVAGEPGMGWSLDDVDQLKAELEATQEHAQRLRDRLTALSRSLWVSPEDARRSVLISGLLEHAL